MVRRKSNQATGRKANQRQAEESVRSMDKEINQTVGEKPVHLMSREDA